MMRLLPIIFFLVCASIQAQTVIIKGRVIDELDLEPIKSVTVTMASNKGFEMKTNDKGEFVFKYTYTGEDKLYFKHVGFQKTEVSITKRKIRRAVKDTVYINVRMPWFKLDAFEVKNPAIPDTVFNRDTISVSDYAFYSDHRFVMLVYSQNLRRGSEIVLVDREQNILDQVVVPDQAERLYKDYLGRVTVICKESVYRVVTFGNDMELQRLDPDLFYRYTVPIVDTANQFIYYSTYNPDYPAFEYYAYDPKDSSRTEIMKVEDKPLMELYRAEYKYVDGKEKLWAYRKERETGIDKEIWIGLKYFTQSLYYQPLYAPLFVVDDEVVVFDHYADQMYLYGDNHTLLDSTVIYYHKMKGKQEWDNLLIQDEKNDKIYTVFLSGGYHVLAEVDLETGEIGQGHKLFFKYAENIHIKNGYIYYIYRPFESAQKKFLYKEKLG